MTYDRFGDESVLQLIEQPTPKVAPGEVLVRVHAAAVNPVDWKVMEGALEPLMDVVFPAVPGWDVAGVVEAVGIDVPDYQVGDEVWAYARKDYVHGGTFAELVSVPVRCLGHKPDELDFTSASAVPLAGLTALQVLNRTHAGLDDTVLVHNGAGGVGQMAIQIAKARGAVVVATASEKNHEYLRSLGADHVVTYGEGLVERVHEVAPDGVDVVVDLVGGVVDDSVALLREGGRLASIVDPGVLAHGGQWLWVHPDHDDLDTLAQLVRDGQLRVEVAETYPLEQLPQAFARSREHHVRGKLVVQP